MSSEEAPESYDDMYKLRFGTSLFLCWSCVLGLVAAAAGGAATAFGQPPGAVAAGAAIACCLCSLLTGLAGHADDEAVRKKSEAMASS